MDDLHSTYTHLATLHAILTPGAFPQTIDPQNGIKWIDADTRGFSSEEKDKIKEWTKSHLVSIVFQNEIIAIQGS